MAWDGFYPECNCTHCGAPLHGQGSGYPAERYAGTYNGLCYPCTSRAAEVVETWSDGSVTVEHPPHCPSWRRDRERFTAYPGCVVCNGSGRIRVSRRDSMGGDYTVQCEACWERRYPHKALIRERERLERRGREVERLAGAYWRKLDKDVKAKPCKKNNFQGGEWDYAWKHHALANEYRQIMKALWEFPSTQPAVVTLVPASTGTT